MRLAHLHRGVAASVVVFLEAGDPGLLLLSVGLQLGADLGGPLLEEIRGLDEALSLREGRQEEEKEEQEEQEEEEEEERGVRKRKRRKRRRRGEEEEKKKREEEEEEGEKTKKKKRKKSGDEEEVRNREEVAKLMSIFFGSQYFARLQKAALTSRCPFFLPEKERGAVERWVG